MKKVPLAAVFLVVLLASGCVTERSFTDDSVRAYIGSRFRTTRPFFLTKEGSRYMLEDERQKNMSDPVAQKLGVLVGPVFAPREISPVQECQHILSRNGQHWPDNPDSIDVCRSGSIQTYQ